MLEKKYDSLIAKIARSVHYSSTVIDFNDLYQVGVIAAYKAIDSYDPSFGVSEKAYVGRLVRQAIFHEAGRFLSIFTVDHRTTSLAAEICRMYRNGLSDKEIASQKNITVNRVKNLRFLYSVKTEELVYE